MIFLKKSIIHIKHYKTLLFFGLHKTLILIIDYIVLVLHNYKNIFICYFKEKYYIYIYKYKVKWLPARLL